MANGDRVILRNVMTAPVSVGARLPVRHPSDREMSLAWRVVLLNSAVMLVASLALALGPATVSTPIHGRELLVLLVGLVATMGANVVLVRRAFAPLRRLTSLMHKVDPLAPGTRLQAPGAAKEVRELADAFNDMLERLENERRDSARRAVRAQEAERRRLARELHDELGQSLTGVLLQIDHAIRTPESADLEDAREGARRSLEDVRRIARDLLVELGLASALNALATHLTRQTGVIVDRHLDPDLPALGDDAEVVLGAVTLTIDDDGRGVPPHVGHEARGITGMRERALLVHGRLRVGRSPTQGTRVRLDIPTP